jgi:hypothetical protein
MPCLVWWVFHSRMTSRFSCALECLRVSIWGTPNHHLHNWSFSSSFSFLWSILSWEVCCCLVFSWLLQSTRSWWGSPKHCFDLRLALNACLVQIVVGPPPNNKSILHCTIIISPHCSRCYCWPSHSIHILFHKIPTYSSCVSYRHILNAQSDISIMWRRVSCQCHGES